MSAAGIDPKYILPDVSETERNYDPISRGKISRAQQYVAEATAKVDRVAPPDLPPLEREQMIGKVATMAAERDRGKMLGASGAMQQPAVSENAGFIERAANANTGLPGGSNDSIIDAIGLGGLRNPETVGDLMPIAGATIGAAIPIKIRASQAKKAFAPLVDPALKMLRARGIDITSSAVGAAVGAGLELRLEQAAAYIESGGDPSVFESAPVPGAFIMGMGAKGASDQSVLLLNRMIQEAMMDMAGSGLSNAATAVVKKGGKMLAGDVEFFRRAARDAVALGVPVGIADTAKSGLASMPRRALAPFGIIGTPFRKGIERTMAGIEKAGTRVSLGVSADLAEIVSLERSDPEAAAILTGRLNSNFFKKFAGAFNAYKGASNRLWQEFEEAAEASGAIVNPAHTTNSAAVRMKKFFGSGIARSIKKDAADQIEGLSKADLEVLGPDVFEEIPIKDDMEIVKDVMDHIQRLEPEPSVMQMSNLGKRVNIALENVKSKSARAALIDVSVGIRRDIEEGLQGASPEALAKLRAAKGLTERFHTLLNGRAGQKVGRVSGDFGEQAVSFTPNQAVQDGAEVVKNAGPVDPTESIDVIMDNASIGEIEQIYGILKLSGEDGKRAFRDALARKLQKSFNVAQAFSAEKAFRRLDLGDPGGKKRTALMRQIGLAGGNPRDVLRLVRLTNHALRDGMADPAVFTARRAILGGVGTIVGSAGLTFAATNSDDKRWTHAASVAAGMFAMSRFAGKILTNPKHTRDLIKVLDPSFGNSASIQALRRLASNGFLGTPEDLEAEYQAAKKAGMGAMEAGAEGIRAGFKEWATSGRNPIEQGTSVNTPLPGERR